MSFILRKGNHSIITKGGMTLETGFGGGYVGGLNEGKKICR